MDDSQKTNNSGSVNGQVLQNDKNDSGRTQVSSQINQNEPNVGTVYSNPVSSQPPFPVPVPLSSSDSGSVQHTVPNQQSVEKPISPKVPEAKNSLKNVESEPTTGQPQIPVPSNPVGVSESVNTSLPQDLSVPASHPTSNQTPVVSVLTELQTEKTELPVGQPDQAGFTPSVPGSVQDPPANTPAQPPPPASQTPPTSLSSVLVPETDNLPLTETQEKKSRFKLGKLPALPIIAGIVLIVLIGGIVVLRALRSNSLPQLGRSGEIIWWGFTEDEASIQPIIAEFEAVNPGVKVSYQKQSPQDYRERLTNSLATGKGPDVFEIHNTWVPMFVKDLETAPSTVLSESEFTQSYYPVIVSDLKRPEGIVGIPLFYDAITLFINQDMFALAAKSPPTTWDEFRDLVPELSPALDSASQSVVPLGFTGNVEYWPEIISLLLYQNKVNLSQPSGQRVADALAFYKSFASTSKWKTTYPASNIAFGRGQTAMYFGPAASIGTIRQENPALNFRSVPLPQIANERPDEPLYSYATYWFQGVWLRSSEKENAWKLLKFISSVESLEKIQENRAVKKPYPRLEMKLAQIDDPLLGSIISLAPYAKSWYMADNTFDGVNGINSQLADTYKKYIDGSPEGAGNELGKAVPAILAKYGIVVK